MRLLLTADLRDDAKVGKHACRVLALLSELEAGRQPVQVLNVNSPISQLRQTIAGGLVLVVADTVAEHAPLPARYHRPHGFRLWLEDERIPFIGNSCCATSRASTGSKAAARRQLTRAGIAVARGTVVRAEHGRPGPASIIRRFGLPLVLKKASQTGGGVSVHFVRSLPNLLELLDWYVRIRRDDVIVEQFVEGREFTVWIRDRRGRPEPYGVIEFRKPDWNPILDRGAKMRCRSVRRFSASPRWWPQALFMPRLPRALRVAVTDVALAAHRACGLRHISRIDLVVSAAGPVVLDVNASPELDRWLAGVAAVRHETITAVIQQLSGEALVSYENLLHPGRTPALCRPEALLARRVVPGRLSCARRGTH